MRFTLPSLSLSLCLWASSANVQAAPGLVSSTGVGLGYVGLDRPGTRLKPSHNFGVAIDGRSGLRFGPVGLNLVSSWVLTEFDRTARMARWGVDTGRWTTDAFRKVNAWVGRAEESEEGLRGIGAFFAYMGLIPLYAVVPAAILASPLAATSSLSLGPTLSTHFGGDRLQGFVEAGIAVLGYVHPVEDALRGGYGPLFGAGLRAGRWGLGLRLLWSPPGAHRDAGPEDANVYSTVITIDRYTESENTM